MRGFILTNLKKKTVPYYGKPPEDSIYDYLGNPNRLVVEQDDSDKYIPIIRDDVDFGEYDNEFYEKFA